MPSTTRGPLPSGTYWRRRLAILSVALVLVLAFGKVLTHFSDGSGADTATQAGTTVSSSFPPPSASTSGSASHRASTKASGRASGNGGNRKGRHRGTSTASPSVAAPTEAPTPAVAPTPTLADPTGDCDDDDVYITPTVASPVLGGSIAITLNLQTQSAEACTWTVSPDTVRVKITSGSDTVWTSQECPEVVPTQDVVVRRALATQVTMTWNAKRSDEYCTSRTAYVLPGTYDVFAAALGGEPTDVQVAFVAPVAAQITETVTPTPTPTPTAKGKHKND